MEHPSLLQQQLQGNKQLTDASALAAILPHLIEAVCAALCEESFDAGVSQHIILIHPLHNFDIASHRY